MKRTTSVLAALCLLATPLLSFAQDEPADAVTEHPKFLMFNQNVVAGEHLEQYNHDVDSLMRPILDAMADEGLISTWGVLNHAWGDEWNWAWFIYTKDRDTFFSAWDELVRRINESDPGAWSALTGPLKRHKDNLLDVRHLKGRPLAEGEAPAGFVMLNQHVVDMKDLVAANALMDSTAAEVLDAMVDEGIIHYWGQANHSWGDEWNFNFYFASESLADFASDWAEFTKRMGEQHQDAWNEWNRLTKAHKDNLYRIHYRQ